MDISNITSLPSLSQDNGVYGAQTIKQTLAGHVEEIDDTLGFERSRRMHPGGTNEEWTNSGRSLTVFGKNYVAVIGDDEIKVTGNVNIIINGNCNTTIKGDYNLNVLGNMNVAVKGNIVEKCDGSHVIETIGDILQHAGQNRTDIVQSDNTVRIKGDYDINVVGGYDLNVGKERSTLIGSDDINLITGAFVTACTGDATIASESSFVMSSATTDFDSDAGEIKLGGVSITPGDVKAGIISLSNHKHGSVQTGTSDTGVPI